MYERTGSLCKCFENEQALNKTKIHVSLSVRVFVTLFEILCSFLYTIRDLSREPCFRGIVDHILKFTGVHNSMILVFGKFAPCEIKAKSSI